MKMLIAASCALYLSMIGSSRADYTLACKDDLAGGRERTDVTIKSTPNSPVNSLREACAVMRSDPQYSDYNWQTCVDPKGRDGTCIDPTH